MNRYRCRTQQGFTLVEVLVALTIFSLGVIAVSGLVVNFFNQSHHIENNSIAIDVMRTGIEIAIHTRNSNVLSKSAPSYDYRLGDGDYCVEYAFQKSTISINHNSTDDRSIFRLHRNTNINKSLVAQLSPCSNYSFGALMPDINSQRSNPNPGVDTTVFTNKISIDNQKDDRGNDYLEIKSIVSWNQGKETLEGEFHLYDWYQ